jgi:hypothetical protein
MERVLSLSIVEFLLVKCCSFCLNYLPQKAALSNTEMVFKFFQKHENHVNYDKSKKVTLSASGRIPYGL